jgi:hypothetical protein
MRYRLSLCLLLTGALPAEAQLFSVPTNLGDSAVLARTMPSLAERVMAPYAKTPQLRAVEVQYEIWAKAQALATRTGGASTAPSREPFGRRSRYWTIALRRWRSAHCRLHDPPSRVHCAWPCSA